jgi:phosphoserine phosphatase
MKCHPRLVEPGWSPAVRRALCRLIRLGAGQGLPVVFDFDNTVVCGDIGEATLAVLVRDGVIARDRIPPHVAPAFVTAAGAPVSLEASVDATEYYEAFLDPTAHGAQDSSPAANGYVWAVEIMQGLRPLDVVRATRTACELAAPGKERLLEVTPGKTSYPLPFLYPESVELIAELMRHEFDVWVVSASNVWSVRWMVLHGLNPALAARGVRKGLTADHVVGVSLLLADPQGRLHKDPVLVRRNRSYAAMDERCLGSLRLTGRLHFPAPTYSGKIACLWDGLRRPPYLAAGDSPGDLPMLAFSQNRLWIARLEKPAYQVAALRTRRESANGAWLVQPTLAKTATRFVPDAPTARRALGARAASVKPGLAAYARLARWP